MSDWIEINKGRIREGRFSSDDSDGCNGAFELFVCSEFVRVIASDGEGWKHVSVSRKRSDKTPTWEMMCKIKDMFWEPEDWVCQFHPAQSEYINNHPGCLHLWQPVLPNNPMQVPNTILVGIKGLTRQEIK